MSGIGTCKLCGQSEVALRDSHLLPKAAYRLLARTQDGDAPIVTNSNVAIATNEQVRGYVFCEQCEARLNKNGEAWTLNHCFRESQGFALREALEAETPVFDNGPELKVWAAAEIASIDPSQLIYFASSIFWRRSVHEWKSGKKAIVSLQLSKKYESQFREFLLGNNQFPENAVLWLNVISDENLYNYFTFPYGGKEKDYWRYQFQFLGLAFTLYLGSLVPVTVRQYCFVRSAKRYITMSKAADNMVLTHARKLQSKSKPIGKVGEL